MLHHYLSSVASSCALASISIHLLSGFPGGGRMEQHISRAGWDVFLFGIPLIALLIFGFFRLDQVFTSRKNRTSAARRPKPESIMHENSMRSDPDGRPWDDP